MLDIHARFERVRAHGEDLSEVEKRVRNRVNANEKTQREYY